MEKTPVQQIDIVLNVFKSDRGHISLDNLYKRTNFIDGDILSRIIEKLIRDKYIYVIAIQGVNFEKYAITFEGFLFHGYEKQQILDNERIAKISRTEVDLRSYKNRLLLATWCAGIAAALLLLWQVWIWFYPVHANYPYWIWQTMPPKH